MSEKKVQTTIMSDPSLKAMVEAYQEATGARTYSAAANDLMIKGLENLDTIKEVLEIQKSENVKLRKELQKAQERIIAFAEENLRYTALAYGYSKTAATFEKNSSFVVKMKEDQSFQKVQEGGMIKAAFKSLKEQKARKEEEAFFDEV
ncbi:hypothetical protein AB0W38_00350 [Aliarcobacter butzleri]|uniref:hypothetical protein n=1 Tax=Aliarcobacter butzleri TaxID=28197 RepID=UPI00344BAADB